MNSSSSYTILGGGIAGLAMANGLKKIGINATVFEASPELKPVGAGLVMAPNALVALDYLGVRKQIEKRGLALNKMCILNQNGGVIQAVDIRAINPAYNYLTIHRHALHEALMEMLIPGQVILKQRSRQVKRVEKGYEIHFESGLVHSTDYLIVAEGIHSHIREQLFPEMKIQYAGYSCWRGICQFPGLSEASETWGKNGRFGLVPLQNDFVYWFAVVNCELADSNYKKFTAREISELFADYHQPIKEVVGKTSDEHIIWNSISDLTLPNELAKEGICFIGDSIHATTPNMGQGACMAVEDAAVFTKALEAFGDFDKACTHFQNKRLERVRFVVKRSRALGSIGQKTSTFYAFLRNGLIRLIPASMHRKQLQKIFDFKVG